MPHCPLRRTRGSPISVTTAGRPKGATLDSLSGVAPRTAPYRPDQAPGPGRPSHPVRQAPAGDVSRARPPQSTRPARTGRRTPPRCRCGGLAPALAGCRSRRTQRRGRYGCHVTATVRHCDSGRPGTTGRTGPTEQRYSLTGRAHAGWQRWCSRTTALCPAPDCRGRVPAPASARNKWSGY